MDEADRRWTRELVAREWGLPVVSVSGVHDPGDLPGLVALDDDERVGALTYRTDSDACEVVTLNALTPGRGIGAALLRAAKEIADDSGARLWLMTTNDNIRAIEFYQRQGLDLVALHRNFIDVVRSHKPTVGDPQQNGIPFRHALEFSY